jgi:excisionase family DNA binding protein
MPQLSVAHAAQTVGIKNLTILRAIQSGRLPAEKTETGEYEIDATGLFRVLGAMYDNGRGVPQDFALAAKWYRRAADEGDPVAQTSLGFMYYSGRGVPQDDVLAHAWFNLAAAQGDATARETRDSIASLMAPEQIAAALRQAREWQLTAKR